ncbi:hypothetical protein CC86DRAFT_144190 [Ophiobolus disseminans]|uniref:Uncharacterized protein n=1 Tax=Ophiobolus disseminans TaxID=1469910 RepID=A0A6A6ZF01_9PLEO|nr:hypothetical protein CC86DRAFT_144190 [Ophiobolus disseminans]
MAVCRMFKVPRPITVTQPNEAAEARFRTHRTVSQRKRRLASYGHPEVSSTREPQGTMCLSHWPARGIPELRLAQRTGEGDLHPAYPWSVSNEYVSRPNTTTSCRYLAHIRNGDTVVFWLGSNCPQSMPNSNRRNRDMRVISEAREATDAHVTPRGARTAKQWKLHNSRNLAILQCTPHRSWLSLVRVHEDSDFMLPLAPSLALGVRSE